MQVEMSAAALCDKMVVQVESTVLHDIHVQVVPASRKRRSLRKGPPSGPPRASLSLISRLVP
ncbi:MAG: hypothetical protein OXH92_18365 [Bryobacterales bacterium]|nr:hypothetical protein [Bryobacterales bacterium]MDE0296018.1 hypothetical protein [Bryobacterales bacterium]MDE0435968.1 hypothetical protein [Bryobacterales bacterium]